MQILWALLRAQHLEIYTDGSKDGVRTAAAVVAPNSVKTVRLPDNACIFTAEIHALNPCPILIHVILYTSFNHLHWFLTVSTCVAFTRRNYSFYFHILTLHVCLQETRMKTNCDILFKNFSICQCQWNQTDGIFHGGVAVLVNNISAHKNMSLNTCSHLQAVAVAVRVSCQICHSPVTVKHILIDCTCFGAARQRCLGSWYTL